MPSSVLYIQSFLLFITIDPKLEVFYGSSTTTAVKPIKAEACNLNIKSTPVMRQASLYITHLLLLPQFNMYPPQVNWVFFTICKGMGPVLSPQIADYS